MAFRARFATFVYRTLFFCGALLLCCSQTRVAQAGFELKLDTTSLRQNGDHYSIDVLFQSSDDIKLMGVQATLTSKTDGLVFLDVAMPTGGGIFGDGASYDPPDQTPSPSSGTAGELWQAFIFASDPAFVLTNGGQAFRLDFSVAGAGQYDIDFVTDPDPDISTDFAYLLKPANGGPGAPDNPTIGYFDVLDSPPILVGTPEPSSLVLLATAMGGLGIVKWRRRSRRPV